MTQDSGATSVSSPEQPAEASPASAGLSGAASVTAAKQPGGVAHGETGEDPGSLDPGIDPDTGVDALPAHAPGAPILALLAVGWLAAMLWSAQQEISAAALDPLADVLTAYALPGVISASLLAGAAVSLALANLLTRLRVARATPRFAVALASGVTTGMLAALTVALTYGGGSSVMVLAGSSAAAAVIGGVVGGVRATRVVGAVSFAALLVLVVNPVLSYFQDPILGLFGASDSVSALSTANAWFARTASMLGGIVAGLIAFWYLRRSTRRAAEQGDQRPKPRWPAYLLAGAGPGLLLMTTELITRTAGAGVLSLAGSLSEADHAVQNLFAESRLNHALLVLFLGAFTATIAFGRSLGPAESTEELAEQGA